MSIGQIDYLFLSVLSLSKNKYSIHSVPAIHRPDMDGIRYCL